MGKPGRRPKVTYRRIALEVLCGEDYCERCRYLKTEDSNCIFFKKELAVFVKDDVVFWERCSSCLMAERVASGERTD